jgi:hypothetical protein
VDATGACNCELEAWHDAEWLGSRDSPAPGVPVSGGPNFVTRFTNGALQILRFRLIGVARFTVPTVLPILTAVARIAGFAVFTGGGVARVGGGSAPE